MKETQSVRFELSHEEDPRDKSEEPPKKIMKEARLPPKPRPPSIETSNPPPASVSSPAAKKVTVINKTQKLTAAERYELERVLGDFRRFPRQLFDVEHFKKVDDLWREQKLQEARTGVIKSNDQLAKMVMDEDDEIPFPEFWDPVKMKDRKFVTPLKDKPMISFAQEFQSLAQIMQPRFREVRNYLKEVNSRNNDSDEENASLSGEDSVLSNLGEMLDQAQKKEMKPKDNPNISRKLGKMNKSQKHRSRANFSRILGSRSVSPSDSPDADNLRPPENELKFSKSIGSKRYKNEGLGKHHTFEPGSPTTPAQVKDRIEEEKEKKPEEHEEEELETDEEEEDFDLKYQKKGFIEGRFFQYHHSRALILLRGKLNGDFTMHAFNRFGYDNAFRQLCIYVYTWKWFDRIVIFLILVNSILLGLLDYRYVETAENLHLKPLMNILFDQLEVFFTVAFGLEMIIKMTAMGVVADKSCYFRDPWNFLDATVVFSSFAAMIPGVANVSAIRTFRLFRPLRSLSALPSMRILVVTLLDSLWQLTSIFMLLALSMLVFACFGLQIWNGAFHKRCRMTLAPVDGDWLTVDGDTQVCGGLHQCRVELDEACGSLLDPAYRDELYALTDEELYRDSVTKELNFGITRYDNILTSYLTVFQVMTLEGWHRIMSAVIDGHNAYVAAFYFICLIIICHYLFLNLTVAVLVLNVSRQKQSEFDDLINVKTQLSRAIESKRKSRGITSSEKVQFDCKKSCGSLMNIFCAFHPGEEPPDKRYDFVIIKLTWRLLKSPFFRLFYVLLIVYSLLILSWFNYPDKDSPLFEHAVIEFICLNALFAIEIILKLIGTTTKQYWTKKCNVIELVVTSLFFVTFTIECIQAGEFIWDEPEKLYWTFKLIMFGSLRCLRLIEVTVQEIPSLAVLVDCISYTMYQVGNFLLLLTIFMYVFTLLGMQLFAGSLRFYKDMTPVPADVTEGDFILPRANFDDLISASVTVFQIIIGEEWNLVLYNCIRATGTLQSVGYFTAVVLFGHIIMMNLFVAMLLGNFQKASLINFVEQERKKSELLFHSSEVVVEDEEKGKMQKIKTHSMLTPFKSILKKSTNFNEQDEDSNQSFNKSIDKKHKGKIKQRRQNKRFDKKKTSLIVEEKDSSFNSSISEDAIDRMYGAKESLRDKTSDETEKSNATQFSTTFDGLKEGPIRRNSSLINLMGLKPGQLFLERQDVKQQEQFFKSFYRKGLDGLYIKQYITQDEAQELEEQRIEELTSPWKIEERERKALQEEEEEKVERQRNQQAKTCADRIKAKFFPEGVNASSLYTYMSQSSLFLFHRKSDFRRVLIRVTCGGYVKPSFRTAERLLEFYTRTIIVEDDGEVVFADNEEQLETPDDEDLEAKVASLFEDTSGTLNDKDFLDLNDSVLVEEVQSVQSHANYDEEKLKEQVQMIKQMLESNQPDMMDLSHKLTEGKARFVLNKDQEIVIEWQKWYALSSNQIFSSTGNIVVLLSTALLVFDNPLADPNSRMIKNVQLLDAICVFLFVIEAFLKMIATGFYNCSLKSKQKTAYIKSMWNCLDFIVVIVSMVDWVLIVQKGSTNSTIGALKALRALRALRPLRMINKLQSLRLSLNALACASRQICNVFLINVLIISIFAIFGQHLFRGTFFRCVIEGDELMAREEQSIIDTKQDCLDEGHEWVNGKVNFDNFGNSLLGLFEIMTTEGWLQVMHDGVDARGIDLQPKRGENTWLVLFFIVYILMGNVFILNLFVGVIVDRFNQINEEMSGYKNINTEQRKQIDIQRMMMRMQLVRKWDPPTAGFRAKMANISASKALEWGIIVTIIANTVTLCLPFMGMSDKFQQVLDDLSLVFLVIFNLEAAVKLTGLGMSYFRDSWNNFDLLICATGDIGIVMQFFSSNSDIANVVVVFRALRICRMVRLVKFSHDFKVLVNSITIIFASVSNIFGLIALDLFVFGILGLVLFHKVMLQEHYNEVYNFRSFGSSCLLLIRCLTGENWPKIMDEIAHVQSYGGIECVDNQTFEDMQNDGILGCGVPLAQFYFILFILVTKMILLNLFIAFILEGFMRSFKEQNAFVTKEDFERLTILWSYYDPRATGWIEPSDIAFLYYELPAPLGKAALYRENFSNIVDDMSDPNIKSRKFLTMGQKFQVRMDKNMVISTSETIEILQNLEVPVYMNPDGHKCHFKDVCLALTKQALQKGGLDTDDEVILGNALRREWTLRFTELENKEALAEYDSGRFWAALFLARLMQNVQVRKKKKSALVECISEVNKKAEYSKYLRTLEIAQKAEEEAEVEQIQREAAMGIVRPKAEFNMRAQATNSKTQKLVRFEDEQDSDADDERFFSAWKGNKISVGDPNAGRTEQLDEISKSVARRKTDKLSAIDRMKIAMTNLLSRYKVAHIKLKDTERSQWWRDNNDPTSSQKKLIQWSHLQDSRQAEKDAARSGSSLNSSPVKLIATEQQPSPRINTDRPLLSIISEDNNSAAHDHDQDVSSEQIKINVNLEKEDLPEIDSTPRNLSHRDPKQMSSLAQGAFWSSPTKSELQATDLVQNQDNSQHDDVNEVEEFRESAFKLVPAEQLEINNQEPAIGVFDNHDLSLLEDELDQIKSASFNSSVSEGSNTSSKQQLN